MKRFYCTICQKVKRTQQWPTILEHGEAKYAEDRFGECNWHRQGHIRPVHVERMRVVKSKPVSQPRSGKARKSA